MLATVLKSKIAVDVNISIMRTFRKLKNLSVPYFDIIKRLETLETDNQQTKEPSTQSSTSGFEYAIASK